MTLRDAWEGQAENWIRFAETPDHDRSNWRFGFPRLLDLLPEPRRLTIDIGCGEGRLPRLLRERGYDVVGIDASPTLIRRATELGAARYVVADAARAPIRDAAADLVIANMSLHDVDDMPSAVAEAARMLVPGGRFCFSILHPINSAGAYAQRTADAPFVIEGSYLNARRTAYVSDRGGIEMTFHSIHRPLGNYVDALAGAGFLIERLAEPAIDETFVEEDRSEIRWQRVPLFLFVSAVKRPLS